MFTQADKKIIHGLQHYLKEIIRSAFSLFHSFRQIQKHEALFLVLIIFSIGLKIILSQGVYLVEEWNEVKHSISIYFLNSEKHILGFPSFYQLSQIISSFLITFTGGASIPEQTPSVEMVYPHSFYLGLISWARFLNLVFDAVTLYLIYYLGKRFYSVRVGLLSVLLYLLSPLVNLYVFKAHPFSLINLLFVCLVFLFFELFRSTKKWNLIFIGLCVGLLAGTTYQMVYLGFFLLLGIALVIKKQPGPYFQTKGIQFSILCASSLLGYLVSTIHFGWSIPERLDAIAYQVVTRRDLAPEYFQMTFLKEWIWEIGVFTAIFSFFGMAYAFQKKDTKLLVLLGYGVLHLLFFWKFYSVNPADLSTSVFVASLLGGIGLDQLIRLNKKKKGSK